MFRRIGTIARRKLVLSPVRKYLTVPPAPRNVSALVGVFGAGAAIGFLAHQVSTKTATISTEPSEKSTSPLETVTPPQYADAETFAKALEEFVAVVGKENVSSDSDVIKSHSDSFFSTHHPPKPDIHHPNLVIYPSSTEQVSQLMKIAYKYRVPVVANSGLTSLEGQNMHTRGPYSVSIASNRLTEVIAFHPDDLDAVVQPGLGWQELDEYLLNSPTGSHLFFGPDPGMGASLGGMTSTSASGTNSQTMRENIINLTVVLADGTIIKTRQRPRKTSAGYDLTKLFIGAEGTLGIITEITVKLQVRPKKELVSVAAFNTIKEAASAAQYIISKSGIKPIAVELLDHNSVSFVNQSGSSEKPLLEKPTLFFKIGGMSESAVKEQADIVEKVSKDHGCLKFEQSNNEEENAVLWAARRNGLWSTFDYGKKVLEDKEDVQIWTTDFAVPMSNLSEIIAATNQDLIESGFKDRFSVLGHVGDGNCHFLILYNSKDYGKVQVVVDRMVERAIKLDGTCTGEHGVGVGKRRYLEPELGKTTVDLMRHIKLSMDPRLILNPDKVFKTDPAENLDALLDVGKLLETGKGCC